MLDICHIGLLDRKGGWRIIITTETWWNAQRAPIRTQLWATHAAGSRDAALRWFVARASALSPAVIDGAAAGAYVRPK